MSTWIPRAVLASFVLASSSFASTWIVDDDGGAGVDFTDIAPAIAAASAGDVILVQPGTYSFFVLDKGLAILGYGTPVLTGPAQVIGVVAPDRAALVGLRGPALEVLSSDATVHVQDSRFDALNADASADVRLARVFLTRPTGPTMLPMARASGSRLEVVDSTVTGQSSHTWTGQTGGTGIICTQGARVDLALSNCRGGSGGPTGSGYGSNGGPAMTIDASSSAVITGGPADVISGGGGGQGFSWCTHGTPSSGVINQGGLLHHSGATFVSSNYACSACYFTCTAPGVTGSVNVAETPASPSLASSGTPQPGSAVVFIVYAEPGTQATLLLGRKPIVNPTPPTVVEQLTLPLRTIDLGIVPASGQVDHPFALPATWPVGFSFYGQAELLYPGGELRRTNSAPIVLR